MTNPIPENVAEFRRQLIADRDREVRELQSQIREIQAKNELALSRTWEIRILKRVLRVIVVILWFILTTACCPIEFLDHIGVPFS